MASHPLRIALISEHASPLAVIGGVDAGGQNIYVAQVARALARAGHHVDVLTRRDDAVLPPVVDVRPGMRVLHIDAGPARFVPKEKLLPHMGAFTRVARALLHASVAYDVVHANFFTCTRTSTGGSGCATSSTVVSLPASTATCLPCFTPPGCSTIAS